MCDSTTFETWEEVVTLEKLQLLREAAWEDAERIDSLEQELQRVQFGRLRELDEWRRERERLSQRIIKLENHKPECPLRKRRQMFVALACTATFGSFFYGILLNKLFLFFGKTGLDGPKKDVLQLSTSY